MDNRISFWGGGGICRLPPGNWLPPPPREYPPFIHTVHIIYSALLDKRDAIAPKHPSESTTESTTDTTTKKLFSMKSWLIVVQYTFALIQIGVAVSCLKFSYFNIYYIRFLLIVSWLLSDFIDKLAICMLISFLPLFLSLPTCILIYVHVYYTHRYI